MGDGTDNFPVLEDRGTAHALDDSTGFFKQSFIRYLDFDSAVDVVVIQVKGFDFDRIELRRSVLLQAAQDLCFPFFYFLFQSNRQCFALYFVRFFLAQGAEDSFDRIYGDRADPVFFLIIDHSGQFSRRSTNAFSNVDDFCFVKTAALYLHQVRRIRIVDSMSQRAEAVFLIQIGHRTHALRVIPNPDAQLVYPLCVLLRRNRHIKGLSVPTDRQTQLLSFRRCHLLRELLFSFQFYAVHL